MRSSSWPFQFTLALFTFNSHKDVFRSSIRLQVQCRIVLLDFCRPSLVHAGGYKDLRVELFLGQAKTSLIAKHS